MVFLGFDFWTKMDILDHFAQVLRPAHFRNASNIPYWFNMLFLNSCTTGRGFNRQPSVDRIFGCGSTVASELMGLWAQLKLSHQRVPRL